MSNEARKKVKAVKAVRSDQAVPETQDLPQAQGLPQAQTGAHAQAAAEAQDELSAGVVLSYDSLEEPNYRRVRTWVNSSEKKNRSQKQWLATILIGVLALLIVFLLLFMR